MTSDESSEKIMSLIVSTSSRYFSSLRMSASSACFREVMSMVCKRNPVIDPCGSRSGSSELDANQTSPFFLYDLNSRFRRPIKYLYALETSSITLSLSSGWTSESACDSSSPELYPVNSLMFGLA